MVDGWRDGWIQPKIQTGCMSVVGRHAERDDARMSCQAAAAQMADSSLISCHVEALPFLAALLSGLYLLVSMRLTKEGGLAIKGLDSIHIFAIRST